MKEERHFTDFDDIEHPLTAAVQAALSRPLPDDAIERVKTRAKQLATSAALQGCPNAETSHAAVLPAAALRWRKAAVAAGGLAAAVLVILWFWNTRESAAWAQMINAVRAKHWIHGLAQASPEDKEKAGEFEIWLSMTNAAQAARNGSWAVYDDVLADVRLEYDPQKKELYRLPAFPNTEQEIKQSQAIFSDLFAGRGVRGHNLDGQRIIRQDRRRATISGREWILYTLSLEGPAVSTRVVFRVDLRTMLPQTMEFFNSQSTEADAKPAVTFDLDYPETGPADIYALGVPRSVKVVDRLPTPDLARVLRSVSDNRKRFADSYYAIVAETTDFGRLRHSWWEVGRLAQVWCKGDRWRVEEGNPEKRDPRTAAYAPAQQPGAGVDKLAWWKEHLKDFDFLPTSVCDGKAMYAPKRGSRNGTAPWEVWSSVTPGQGRLPAVSFGPASANMPEFRAYPITLQAAGREKTAELVRNPADGPAGAVLVKYRDSRSADRWGVTEDRLWVDPARSFVTLREDMSLPSGLRVGSALTWNTWLSEEFAQTPGGIWYATAVRWMSTDKVTALRKEGLVYRFFVEFNVDIADSLFKPDPMATVKATTPPPPSRGRNDLRDIGIAMQCYNERHGKFPAAYTVDKHGRPLLSWRVQLLPWLGQEELYKRFHLDETWDSPHNRSLIGKMPDVYGLGDRRSKEAGRTRYLVRVGKETVFPGSDAVSIRDIRDGCANTIMAVEAGDDRAVIWTKPQDLAVDAANSAEGLPKGGFWALMCDGSVRGIPKEFDPKYLRAAFTRDGGEAIEW